jgi:exonuclease SbcD
VHERDGSREETAKEGSAVKIAHIADIHWGLGYPGPNPTSRFEDITLTAHWVAKRIMEEHCDLVLVAGDLFKDANVFINRASKEITAAVNWLRALSAVSKKVIVISGTPSHDAVAAYEIIKQMQIQDLHIVTTPDVIKHDSAAIACIPGMNRTSFAKSDEYKGKSAHEIHQAMTDAITQLSMGLRAECDRPIRILMTHLTAEGADKGFDDLIMQHEPILKKEAMMGYDLVCLGHIHRPQQVPGVLAYYSGSIERLSFKDEDVKTGFYIHDVSDAGVKSTFIKTPARRYLSLALSAEEALGLCSGSISAADMAKGFIEDSIIRVKYDCTDEEAKLINPNRLKQAFYDAGAYYVTEIKPVITKTVRTRAQEATAEITPLEGIKIYCDLMGIKEVAELTDRTNSILEEVQVK